MNSVAETVGLSTEKWNIIWHLTNKAANASYWFLQSLVLLLSYSAPFRTQIVLIFLNLKVPEVLV